VSREGGQRSSVSSHTSIWNTPDHDITILRDRGNDVVIERMEVKIKDSTLVTREKRRVTLSELSVVLMSNHTERTSSCYFPSHSKELGVGFDEVAIPSTSCYVDVLVTLLRFGSSSKDVSEL